VSKVIATISKAALRHNYAQVKALAPGKKIMAMVKANAYGHGLVTVAQILDQADSLGVACIEEAQELIAAKIVTPITLMQGIFVASDLSLVAKFNLSQVLHSAYQVAALMAYRGPLSTPFKVWLKLNLGMNRLGFKPADFAGIYAQLIEAKHIQVMGFMTHFPQADEPQDATLEQYALFKKLLGTRVGARSLANSAAILQWPEVHADWVRPGLMLYGASPLAKQSAQALNLQPVMQLTSYIIAIQVLKYGETVGYGATWYARQANTRIAILAIGYGDGYPWQASCQSWVMLHQQAAPIVGRVAMDMIAIDISAIEQANIGDPVILWGQGLPVEVVATACHSIPYELFCQVTDRVSRIVVE
jgi:alanine racemase